MPSLPAVSNGRDGSSILWVGEFQVSGQGSGFHDG